MTTSWESPPRHAGTEKGRIADSNISGAADDPNKLTKVKRKGKQGDSRRVCSKKYLEDAPPLDPKIIAIIATEHNNSRTLGHSQNTPTSGECLSEQADCCAANKVASRAVHPGLSPVSEVGYKTETSTGG